VSAEASWRSKEHKARGKRIWGGAPPTKDLQFVRLSRRVCVCVCVAARDAARWLAASAGLLQPPPRELHCNLAAPAILQANLQIYTL